jgi:hypothetical protein
MYRLQFAENLQLPKQRGGSKVDPVKSANLDAHLLEEQQVAHSAGSLI